MKKEKNNTEISHNICLYNTYKEAKSEEIHTENKI